MVIVAIVAGTVLAAMIMVIVDLQGALHFEEVVIILLGVLLTVEDQGGTGRVHSLILLMAAQKGSTLVVLGDSIF